MLRHRTLGPTIYLTEVIRKPFALSRVFFLSSGGKSAVLAKKNAPPRSGILLSMHVVLKTRHANPNIHVRRFIVHVRSPNLSATRPATFIPTRSSNLIWVCTAYHYSFASPPPVIAGRSHKQVSRRRDITPPFSTAQGGISLRGGRKGEAEEGNINLYWSAG